MDTSEKQTKLLPGQPGNSYGRWKPGQSGNPKGRPLSRPFKQSFERILNALEPGDPERALDKLNAAMYAKAINGDVAAYKELADRYEGKVPNPIGGTDELPPITAFAWKPTQQIESSGEPSIANDPGKPGNLDGSPSVDSGIESIIELQKDDKANDD